MKRRVVVVVVVVVAGVGPRRAANGTAERYTRSSGEERGASGLFADRADPRK